MSDAGCMVLIGTVRFRQRNMTRSIQTIVFILFSQTASNFTQGIISCNAALLTNGLSYKYNIQPCILFEKLNVKNTEVYDNKPRFSKNLEYLVLVLLAHFNLL